MYFVAALIFTSIGLVFFTFTKAVVRRQGTGTGVCSAMWGGLFVLIGILDFGQGFGHPLVPEHTRRLAIGVFMAVCLVSLLLIRNPKRS